MSYTDVEYKFKKIGTNVQIGKNVYFRYPDEVEIGNNVIIDEFCFFTTSVKLSDYVHIAPSCTIIGGKKSQFIMASFSAMGAGTRVICASDDFVKGPFGSPVPIEFRPNCVVSKVELEKHTIIGTNTVIHPGVIIKEGAVTGSLTLVTKSLDPWGVYIGIPAKFVKFRDRDYILESEKKFLESISKLDVT